MSAKRKAASKAVIDVYMKACAELFSAYGLTTRVHRQHAEPGVRKTSYVSVLSATGEGIRFSSTLNVEAGLLSQLHPSGAANVPQRDLEDWCLELNNQLVGRVKNKLLRLGCEVASGLPVLITGNDINTVVGPEQDFREYFFASEHGQLALTLALVLAPDLELDETSAAADAVRLEGEHALF